MDLKSVESGRPDVKGSVKRTGLRLAKNGNQPVKSVSDFPQSTLGSSRAQGKIIPGCHARTIRRVPAGAANTDDMDIEVQRREL